MAMTHVFVRALVRRPIRTPKKADEFLCEAVRAAGMRIIAGPYSVMGVVPGNEGVSATAILDLSSAALHEWPFHRPHTLIHFDLFTCGPVPETQRFLDLFATRDPVEVTVRVLDRDLIFDPRFADE